MAAHRVLLVAGALAAVGAGIAAWALWPKEEEMLVRALGRVRSDGFDVALQGCRSQETVDDVLRCVAAELYPEASWPPPDNASAWQRETWRVLDERVREALGLPPKVRLAALKL